MKESEIQPELTSEVLPIEEVILQDGVTQERDSFVVSDRAGHVILTTDGDGNAEYFVRFSDIDCRKLVPSEWEKYRIWHLSPDVKCCLEMVHIFYAGIREVLWPKEFFP